jgi:heme-degrading monooxygenase HmoA
MTYVMVLHHVEDYDRWKPVFDGDSDTRKDRGSKGAFILRNNDDPNHLVVLTEWENIEIAKNFVESEELKNTMVKAGVIGRPAVFYLEEIERTEY